MIDISNIIDKVAEQNRIINEGTKQELVDYAKQFDIFQDRTNSKLYAEICQRIEDKLKTFGVDIESLKD